MLLTRHQAAPPDLPAEAGLPDPPGPPDPRDRPAARWALAVVVVAAAALVPWIAYLDVTLPPATTAYHWPLAWSGLDGAIAAGLAATAWLAARGHRGHRGHRDRHYVRPAAAATVALMAADAWFDVCTSPPGRPLAWAVTDMIVEAAVASACLLLAWTARPAERS
jgi:hypothetical protein